VQLTPGQVTLIGFMMIMFNVLCLAVFLPDVRSTRAAHRSLASAQARTAHRARLVVALRQVCSFGPQCDEF
jgi:hypothetical protein